MKKLGKILMVLLVAVFISSAFGLSAKAEEASGEVSVTEMNQVMTIMLVIICIGILIDKQIFTRVENHILRKRGLLQK